MLRIPNDDERLWRGKSTAPSDPVYYCGCDPDAGDSGEVVCEASEEHHECIDRVIITHLNLICYCTIGL